MNLRHPKGTILQQIRLVVDGALGVGVRYTGVSQMAGGATNKPSSSRASTRSTTINAASGSYNVNGNKLGFIRTAGSGKRKSITDPEIRETNRQKMSKYYSAVPIMNTAPLKGSSSEARGTGRPSKLPLKPNKTTCSNTSVSPEEEAMQGVEHMSSSMPDNSERPSPSSAHSGAVGGSRSKESSVSGGGGGADETGKKTQEPRTARMCPTSARICKQ